MVIVWVTIPVVPFYGDGGVDCGTVVGSRRSETETTCGWPRCGTGGLRYGELFKVAANLGLGPGFFASVLVAVLTLGGLPLLFFGCLVVGVKPGLTLTHKNTFCGSYLLHHPTQRPCNTKSLIQQLSFSILNSCWCHASKGICRTPCSIVFYLQDFRFRYEANWA